jgi:hypothetical protein
MVRAISRRSTPCSLQPAQDHSMVVSTCFIWVQAKELRVIRKILRSACLSAFWSQSRRSQEIIAVPASNCPRSRSVKPAHFHYSALLRFNANLKNPKYNQRANRFS